MKQNNKGGGGVERNFLIEICMDIVSRIVRG